MATPVQASFDDLGSPLSEVTFCVLDTETTGGAPGSDAITEIGAVKVRGGEVLGTFQTLVNPGREIPPFITVLTGITQAMVTEAPPIEAVLPAFCEFVEGSVVVGHNVRFDLGFLNAACDRLGYPRLGERRADTIALARRLVRSEVRNLKLGTLAAHLRSPVTPTHRALDDARATLYVLWGLLERAGTLGVTHLEDLLRLPTGRGSPHLSKLHLATELPREPGVYLFRDRHGTVLYVGKAKNLRTRVAAYFHGGDDRRRIGDLLRQTHTVDHQVCAGELEAQVTELRLIAAHRPRHNRRSRPPKASHWVTLLAGRFPRLSLTRTLHPDALTVLGPFRSRKAAEVVMHALWDATPIRRCTGRPGSRPAPCGPAQLGLASCPCDGSLTEEDYRPVVGALVAGVEGDPSLLLDPLADRMRTLAGERRFEEAAWVRDRHRALARALEGRRRWQALCRAGWMELESLDGERVVVEGGRLVAAWRTGHPPPLLPPPTAEAPDAPVPPDVTTAEETRLIWSWMEDRRARLTDATGPLALPALPVAELRPTG